MKYNFGEVKVHTLDGQEVPNVDKTLANSIYMSTKDLGLVSIAQDIYAGKEVEIGVTQLEEIKRIVQDEKTGFFAFVQKAILDFLNK